MKKRKCGSATAHSLPSRLEPMYAALMPLSLSLECDETATLHILLVYRASEMIVSNELSHLQSIKKIPLELYSSIGALNNNYFCIATG